MVAFCAAVGAVACHAAGHHVVMLRLADADAVGLVGLRVVVYATATGVVTAVFFYALQDVAGRVEVMAWSADVV